MNETIHLLVCSFLFQSNSMKHIFHLSTHFQVKNLWFFFRYGNDKKNIYSITRMSSYTNHTKAENVVRIDERAKKIYGQKQKWEEEKQRCSNGLWINKQCAMTAKCEQESEQMSEWVSEVTMAKKGQHVTIKNSLICKELFGHWWHFMWQLIKKRNRTGEY